VTDARLRFDESVPAKKLTSAKLVASTFGLTTASSAGRRRDIDERAVLIQHRPHVFQDHVAAGTLRQTVRWRPSRSAAIDPTTLAEKISVASASSCK